MFDDYILRFTLYAPSTTAHVLRFMCSMFHALCFMVYALGLTFYV